MAVAHATILVTGGEGNCGTTGEAGSQRSATDECEATPIGAPLNGLLARSTGLGLSQGGLARRGAGPSFRRPGCRGNARRRVLPST